MKLSKQAVVAKKLPQGFEAPNRGVDRLPYRTQNGPAASRSNRCTTKYTRIRCDLTMGRLAEPLALGPQHPRHHCAQVLVVIDDQEVCGLSHD
jgi:hypothetical protein